MWQSLKEHRALAVVLLLVAGVAGAAAVSYRQQALPMREAGVAPRIDTSEVEEAKVAPKPDLAFKSPKLKEVDLPAVIASTNEPPNAQEDAKSPEPQLEPNVAVSQPVTEPVDNDADPAPREQAEVQPPVEDVAQEAPAAPKLAEEQPQEPAQTKAQAEPAPEVEGQAVQDVAQIELKATETASDSLSPSAPLAQDIAATPPTQPSSDVVETTPTSPRVPEVQAEAETAALSPIESSPTAPTAEAVDDRYKPRFDLVRVEPDGSAVIAGKAPAGAVVTILSDGIELGQATATSRGEFVAFVNTVPTQEVQTLELQAQLVEGPVVISDDTVLLLAKTETAALSLPAAEATPRIPTIVKATSQGISVVQSPDLAVLDHVSLDTIGYDAEGEVVLTGRGTPGQRVFIYADGKPVGANAISERGSWRMVMVDLTAGRYVLRVDEVGADGKVLSRVESPFQRVFPEAELLADGLSRNNVIVQPGSNLWTIARLRYGSGVKYTQIYQANRDLIRNPDLIYPGQIFDLPDSE